MADTKTAKYVVTTKTSKEYKVGTTDSEVFMQMIGENGKQATPWLLLDNLFRDDFELGREDTFNLKTKDIGVPDVIRLKINKKKEKCGWLCETVTIKTPSEGNVVFSVYDWIYEEIAVARGGAKLPQSEDTPLLRDIRRIEVERNKTIFQWHMLPSEDQAGWSLPRYGAAEEYMDLPSLFQINDEQLDNFRGQREVALFNTLIDFGKNLLRESKLTTTEDYWKFFRHPSLPKEMPPFCNCWSTDEEYGRQLLNGVNPTTLCRCTEIPAEFQRAEKEIFDDDRTLQTELEAKRLYYINYRKYTSGVKRNCSKAGKPLYASDPICLLHVGKDGKLRPVAIELEENGCIFTPKDGEHDWLLAKSYFRNTDVNIHEWKYHFLRTHAIMEPIAIGMFRSFSRRHPIYKLLRPHLQTVPAINTLARTNLIGPTAATNISLSINGLEMARCAFQTLEYEDLIIPKVFKQQGTDDFEALPFYHYRDDALLLWHAIQKFVSNVLQFYYKNDQDICEDSELTEFVRTVAVDGIEWAGQGLKGFPVQLHTFEELVEYITIIIFTCSVQHAASNFGQFELYKFVPNAPGGMRLPPHKKGEGTLKRLLDSLPDHLMSVLQLGTAFTLSTYSPNEIYLGQYPMKLFMEEKVLREQEEFRNDLEQISLQIRERNKSLSIPYVYLLPERIPNNIAV